MRCKLPAALGVVLAVLVPFAPCQEAPPAGLLVAVPEQVEVSLFYAGATVEVVAQVPAGYEGAVRLMARPERLELKRLGKKAGVLWMGAGDVSFENIPVMYQVLTTASLAELCPKAERARWLLGYDSLIPDGAPGAALRSELVGLKEHEGLFAVREGALTQRPATDASPAPGAGWPRLLRGAFRLPARAPAGDYRLDLIGFKDQRAFPLGSATLRVQQVGTVRAVRELARNHGLFYGIAACLVAIVAGFVTGRLFRSKADGAH